MKLIRELLTESSERKFKIGDTVVLARDSKSDYGNNLSKSGVVKVLGIKTKGDFTYIVKIGSSEIKVFESDLELVSDAQAAKGEVKDHKYLRAELKQKADELNIFRTQLSQIFSALEVLYTKQLPTLKKISVDDLNDVSFQCDDLLTLLKKRPLQDTVKRLGDVLDSVK